VFTATTSSSSTMHFINEFCITEKVILGIFKKVQFRTQLLNRKKKKSVSFFFGRFIFIFVLLTM
jgi:hypothetical protein